MKHGGRRNNFRRHLLLKKNEMGSPCSTVVERRGVHRVLVGILGERDHLEDPGLDGSIILGRIFRKWDVGVWTGSNWLRIGTDGRHL
jgi:hypothetical protein